MSIYERHVFFCTNHRENGAACNHHGATDLCAYAKKRLTEAAPEYAKRVRVNRAGCLARCQDGPVIVVYPEAVWYTYIDAIDIDEIVNEHLINGRFVERLRIDESFQFQK
ncbi:ferredoxin [Rhodoferax sp. U11-2br]|uniref:(2Fe-2S) ferredoxin domain-containing protein n=1 Tax=Rhodoferax sp. U11-2br TaxID=2838878 RepID=UPI001BE52290|nr:(2Fe-2S) ferredoxin domain-containing protein [Rhodoferax sp. U11-2br]MBT3066617.1 (2Fe-2S) ferredoxin domain-containing protein [Rhodoferax sp. U11-2br]